ncbi:hypothetical protein SAMN05216420_101262 [Nitrosospira sp. Nl5]|nr:hypothetical protein SAMN05216420_101262 [Nitrosospira sp. Nl5]
MGREYGTACQLSKVFNKRRLKRPALARGYLDLGLNPQRYHREQDILAQRLARYKGKQGRTPTARKTANGYKAMER